jgi:hypothetical protein
MAAGLLAAGLFAAPAASAATGGISVPMGLFGLPSVTSILEGIVNFFFGALARALVPDFLKHASVATIKWLVAAPNPTQWRHVGALAGDMRALSVSVLGVCFTAAIVRHCWVLAVPGTRCRLADTLMAAAWLVAYPWAAGQAIAAVNTLTNAILSFPGVGDGLQRTVGILFGGALLVGAGGVFLAVQCTSRTAPTSRFDHRERRRAHADSDDVYVVDLCDGILSERLSGSIISTGSSATQHVAGRPDRQAGCRPRHDGQVGDDRARSQPGVEGRSGLPATISKRGARV